MPGKKKRSPSPRLRNLVKHLAAGKTRREAERLAGYTTKAPGRSAYQALQNAAKNFSELLDAHGLTDSALIENHVKPLLNAETQKFFAHNGKVKSTRRVADHTNRRETLDMVFRLKGSYAPVQSENTTKHRVSVIVMDVPRPKRDEIKDTNTDPAIDLDPSSNGHKKTKE